MLLPLMAVAGMGLAEKYFRDQLTEKTTGLLGAPEGARAGDEGPVQIPGRGLLADPANVQNQMKFAQGLLSMPGGERALRGFAPMLQQAVQSKQWEAGQAQQASQFDRGENRMASQFAAGQDWQQQEAQRAQQNWQANFDEQARQNAQTRAIEGARLQLSRENAAGEKEERAWRMKQRDDKEPPKWGVVDTASGKSLMPSPGTDPFATATKGEGVLVNAISTIDALRDEYLGKEETTAGGHTRRVGGLGSEWNTPWSNGAGFTSMNNKRGSIIAALGSAREMGVLDKNEYDRLTLQLPEVNDFRSKPEKFEAAYKGVRDEFQRKLDVHRRAHPWLVPPPPPGYK